MNPGWGTRTRSRTDSSHGGCDRRRRLALCSARSEREKGGGGQKQLHKNVQLWMVARCEGKGPAIDQPAGVTFYLLSGHNHDCARVRLRLRHRGGSKKKKIFCTNLVYFQAVITMTLHLPPSHSLTHSLTSSFSLVFSLFQPLSRFVSFTGIKIYTQLPTVHKCASPWRPTLMCIRLSFWTKIEAT